MRPSLYPPRLPLPRGMLFPSCPTNGVLLYVQTSSVVLTEPPSLPSPASSPRTRCGDLGPQPLRPESGRLGRGRDRDRMGTGMESPIWEAETRTKAGT